MDKFKWWQNSVIYQIYPRSFMDSNGDGIGDICGIISRLDYLKYLGVDAIWLCPVCTSPNVDNGYDISDYHDIQSTFGTLDDYKKLIEEAHKRGLKVIMDQVFNHSSDKHPWFQQALEGRDNPYRDYYIWVDGEKGVLPNNWESHFSGPAWEYDDKSGQYYLHIFSKHQPDLNWENEKVRKEVIDVLNYWIDLGVDGFRLDVINFISKVPGFPSVPGKDGLVRGSQFYMNGPKVHDYIREIVGGIKDPEKLILIGETPNVTPLTAPDFVAPERKELNLVIQFEHVNIDAGERNKWDIIPWKLTTLKGVLSKWQTEMSGKGWNGLYIGNHDQARCVSRFGNDGEHRVAAAKMLSTMLLSLQGTPFIFQGDEIGMTNVAFASIDDYRDVQIINLFKDLRSKGVPEEEIMKKIYYRGRDNARTPMQWNSSEKAGFTTGEPWISINENKTFINVEDSIRDEDSVFNYYRRLIAIRKSNRVFTDGLYKEYLEDSEKVFCFTRSNGTEEILVLLSFSSEEEKLTVPDAFDVESAEVLISNYEAAAEKEISLPPYGAAIFTVRR
ncbi:MAG: alpha-glucosidase [Candidatus Ornithospirochaeta sp.]